ncbi:hypothetical protein [Streptomyces sp. NPDC017260]|uniref:hypothetical protein n=1 Tax=unclassified Streptomyces TaxID=2593676 RepID=UPI0037A30A00
MAVEFAPITSLGVFDPVFATRRLQLTPPAIAIAGVLLPATPLPLPRQDRARATGGRS